MQRIDTIVVPLLPQQSSPTVKFEWNLSRVDRDWREKPNKSRIAGRVELATTDTTATTVIKCSRVSNKWNFLIKIAHTSQKQVEIPELGGGRWYHRYPNSQEQSDVTSSATR